MLSSDPIFLRSLVGAALGVFLYSFSWYQPSQPGRREMVFLVVGVMGWLLILSAGATIGVHVTAMLGQPYLSRADELVQRIVLGGGAILGLWLASIASQFVGNANLAIQGKKPESIEWFRKTKRNRRHKIDISNNR